MKSLGTLRTTLIGLTALSAVVPALAEAHVHNRLEQALGRCRGTAGCGSVGRLDLDLEGLHLHDIARSLAGHRVDVDRIDVRPTMKGVDVRVHGMQLEPDSQAAAPRRPATPNAENKASGPRAPAKPPLVDTHGIPVQVEVLGPVKLPTVHGATTTLGDVQLTVDPAGRLEVELTAQVQADRGGHTWHARSHGPMRARPTGSWRHWSVSGAVALREGSPLHVEATLSPRALEVHATEPEGGRLELQASLGAEPTLWLRAAAFPLHPAGEALRIPAAHGIDLRDATLHGTAEVASAPLRAHVDELTLTGAAIADPKLEREPVTLGELTMAGDATWDRGSGSMQMTLAHDGAQVHVSGVLDPKRAELHAELPSMPCQTLLDAMPAEIAGILRGTTLRGDLEGHVDLTISRTELAAARQADVDELVEPPRPGTLDVSFPFLQRCEVVRDAPDLDVDALAGPYRHRFVDATGRERSRVMATGGEGFVSLQSADRIAGAFVVLEDARFWQHDGFDRKQIENAWWHNLVVGRVSRGASTITQQAARNLFLGIDRTLGRKLQEAFVASRLEARLPKQRILELYLNVIELAPGIHGVDDAAKFYFGKPASDLSVLQAVHLASMAPAPSTYAKRFRSGRVDQEWRADLHDQVRRLYLHHTITHDQYQRALQDDLNLLDRTEQ